MQESPDPSGNEKKPTPPIERSKFGGTDHANDARRHKRGEELLPPVSSRELGEAQRELEKDFQGRPTRKSHVNWPVFIISSIVILAFSLWAIFKPDAASDTMADVVAWGSANLGWIFVVTTTAVILFVLWVAFSKEGQVRLGPDHSRPQYKLFTWVAMLFAAGVGIDMLFYSVTGPISQYYSPPMEVPESPAAARDAVIWTMFHYGIAGWSMYALLGMAMGYFAYRWGMPLSIRAALYPLIGKRIKGAPGDVIDIFALVGTVMGVATSMGIGVVLLAIGFATLFGLEAGLALQIGLVLVAVLVTIAATSSGVDKGVRIISELNLWAAAALVLYIVVTGKTSFLLHALVENVGEFVWTLPERHLQTMAYEQDGSEWMASWTLFFWAFWLAWGPFVGVFLARISRGRTIREFVIAAITVPVLCDIVIISVFGNSGLAEVFAGNTEFAELAQDSPEQGFYSLLEMFPGSTFLIALATFSGLLFYLTSANSGAMVMSNFSSFIPDPAEDGAKWLRVFWSLLTAVLTIAMLIAGGVTTMEYATLIFALPVTVIAWLVMASFLKALRMERAEREGRNKYRRSQAAGGGYAPERSWRQRVSGLRSYPSKKSVTSYIERTVVPALTDVTNEFREQGYAAELSYVPDTDSGVERPTFTVHVSGERNFLYQVVAVSTPIPTFGGRTPTDETNTYFRLEVFTHTGSEGYNLMGITKQQLIDDVLDRYEAHLMFLGHSSDADASSFVTPAVDPDTTT